MSEFYGRTQGGRSEATRCGTAASGIRSTVETWASIVRSSFRMTADRQRHLASIEVTDKHGTQTGLRFDIDADGLARFAHGEGVGGEYGGDDPDTTATLDELREQITKRLELMRTTADEINDLLYQEASLSDD